MSNDDRTLPLLLHMIDVATAAEIILEQWSMYFEHDEILNLRRIAIFLAGAHDIGKAIPQFQRQHDSSYQLLRENFDFHDVSLSKPYGTATYVPHGYASFVVLNQYLRESMQLNRMNARWLSRCVAGHHGVFPSMDDVKHFKPESYVMGNIASWGTARTQLLDILAEVLNIPKPFDGFIHLSHANIIKLAGLTTVADWVASQATDLHWQDDFVDVQTYYVRTKSRLYDELIGRDCH
jgi:CRISPR-associated endonuclease/helicase Cas3